MIRKDITINSRKFDGSIHKSWKADLIEHTNSSLIFIGKFDEEVNHPNLGVIRRGAVSYEYYWLNRWYNIFLFKEPNGNLRNYYCNVCIPPTFDNGVLDYVDLDIDIVVWKDYTYEILDRDEFIENAEKYNYSTNVESKVEETLERLIEIIESRKLPPLKLSNILYNQDVNI